MKGYRAQKPEAELVADPQVPAGAVRSASVTLLPTEGRASFVLAAARGLQQVRGMDAGDSTGRQGAPALQAMKRCSGGGVGHGGTRARRGRGTEAHSVQRASSSAPLEPISRQERAAGSAQRVGWRRSVDRCGSEQTRRKGDEEFAGAVRWHGVRGIPYESAETEGS